MSTPGGSSARAAASSTSAVISPTSYGTSVNGFGVTVISVTNPTSRTLGRGVECGRRHLGHLACLLGRLAGQRGEGIVLVLTEAGETPEVARQLDRVLVVLA